MGSLCIQGWSAGFQRRESLLGNLPGEQKPKGCSLGATQPAHSAAGRWCWASIGQGAECSFPAEGSPRALSRGGPWPLPEPHAARQPLYPPNTVGPH